MLLTKMLRLQLAKHWQKLLAQSQSMFPVEVCQKALENLVLKTFSLMIVSFCNSATFCCRFGES